MVKSIKIYIEGGGDAAILDAQFRAAWSTFFKNAGLSGNMPRIVRGKGRGNTYDLFKTAVNNPTEELLPILLIDAEDQLEEGHTVWQHLEKRDNMKCPTGAPEEQAYLMGVCMETWLLADIDALERYFGKCFKRSKIPNWPQLEAVEKTNVFAALKNATKECGNKKEYAKGKISFELLATIDPNKVAEKCPHAQRLLQFLKER